MHPHVMLNQCLEISVVTQGKQVLDTAQTILEWLVHQIDGYCRVEREDEFCGRIGLLEATFLGTGTLKMCGW